VELLPWLRAMMATTLMTTPLYSVTNTGTGVLYRHVNRTVWARCTFNLKLTNDTFLMHQINDESGTFSTLLYLAVDAFVGFLVNLYTSTHHFCVLRAFWLFCNYNNWLTCERQGAYCWIERLEPCNVEKIDIPYSPTKFHDQINMICFNLFWFVFK